MGIGAFIVFASVELLYQLSDIIVRHRVGILKLFELIYYNLPYFASLGIPVGILFSIFWVLSQLYSSKEITAFLVHGIPSRKLVYPFLILSIIFGAVSFYLNDQIVPKFNQKAMETISKYVYKKPEVTIKENVLTKIDESQYFFVKRYDQQQGILYDVVLFQNMQSEERIITAKKVEKEENSWYLINGKMYVTDRDGFMKLDLSFSKIKLDLKDDLESLMRVGKSPRDMTGEELIQKIKTFKKLGVDPSPWIVELHGRYANSVGPFIIVILGVPLSLLFGLKSKSWSVIFTFVIVVLYQGSGAWLSAMGKENLINPVLAAWYPDLLFAIVGFILFAMLDTPVAYRIRELIAKFLVIFFVFFIGSNLYSKDLTLDASSIEYNTSYIYASQNVNIYWEDISLFSDEATVFLIDDKVKVLEAEGNVVLRRENKEYYSNYMKYFFDNDDIYIVKVKGVEKYKKKGKDIDLYFNSEFTQKSSETVLMKEAYVTTCELENPHYKIEALRVYVYDNKFLIAENSILFLLDIPLFPYPVYFLNLTEDEFPPFSFSLAWDEDGGFITHQEYNLYVNDYLLSTKITTENKETIPQFSIYKKDDKKTKFSIDYEKNYIYLDLKNLKYNSNWVTNKTFFHVGYSPFYFEEYLNNGSYYKKFGLNFDLYSKGKMDINFYWDGNKSRINNSFSIINVKKDLSLAEFNIQNLSFNNSLEKSTFFTDDSTWTLYQSGNYSFSFKNKSFSTKFYGKVYNDTFSSNIRHTFSYPLSFENELVKVYAKYGFGANLYNAIVDKYYFNLGLYDIYELSGKLKFKVFDIEAKYELRENFRDESTNTEYNKLSSIVYVNTPNLNFSLKQGWDFLNERRLDDEISSKFSFIVLNGKIELESKATYDNEEKKLSPYDVSLSYVNKPFSLIYRLNTKYYVGEQQPIKELTHIFTFQKLKGKVVQSIEENYVKSAYVNGTFSINNYKNTLELSYGRTSKEATPEIYCKYSLKNQENSLDLSYKTSTKILTFGFNLKTIDPGISFYTTYDIKNERFNNLKATLSKSLHHWVFEVSSEFEFNHDQVFNFDDVKKLSVLFYIKEFDDKFLGWDFKENSPNIGLF